MRVLTLHSRYLSGDTSGENRVVEDEARLLREAGHAVWTWTPSPDVDSAAGQVRTAASAIWSASAARRAVALVRKHAVQVVHVHNLFPLLSPAVLRALRRSGAAVVVTLHNYRLMCLPATLLRDGRICEDCVGRTPIPGIRHRCYRSSTAGSAVLATSLALHRGIGTFDGVQRFLAVSEFLKRKHEQIGIAGDRIQVKGNFAWPTEPRSGPGEYFLFLGRLAREKGVDTLLEAWRVAGGELGRLLVVGDGPEEAALRGSAPAGVEFLGSVPSEQLAPVVTGARAVLVPSRWYEAAVPKVVLEAYAAGIPVVAADIAALPDGVIEGRSGFLAPPDDPAAWADRVRRLLDDAESERLGSGALELWAQRYSPERGLAGLEDVYRGVVSDAGA